MDNLQRVQSVVAAHQVLEALAARSGGTSLTELARDLDMTPSRVLRHLATLVELHLVERTGAEPVYRLGIGLVRLGTQAAAQHDVGRIALPVLRGLNESCGQAVSLVRRQGQNATVWLSFESSGSPRLTMAPGMSFSLTGSACGRVMLAFAANHADHQALPMAIAVDDQFPDPIAGPAELERRLSDIRARGFDHYGTDLPNAVFSLAAPILDHRGQAVAALGMFGFSIHYVGHEQSLTSALLSAANEISRQMGAGA